MLGSCSKLPQQGIGGHGGAATGGPRRIRAAECPESMSTDALDGGEDRGDQEDESSALRGADRWSQIKLSGC